MRIAITTFVFPLALLGIVAACNDDEETTAANPDAGAERGDGSISGDAGDAVTIGFEARVGADRFSCSKLAAGMGTTAATIEPLDFRVYVHDVRLIRDDGVDVPLTLASDGKWQYQNLALLDFEDKSGTCINGTTDVNTTLRGSIASGSYTGIKFEIGVPFELNHADVATAPSPLNLSGLFWSWNGGYKFARIDGRSPAVDAGMSMDAGMPMDGGMEMDESVFSIHLGSTDCQGDPANGGVVTSCERPNVGEVVLRGFDPTKKTILVDYKALVAGNDLTTNGGGAPGCMSGTTDPECPALLARFGINPTTGQPDATHQALFRVE
ncbi:hypothetical protein AKJ09_02131 [Labilithrix luteola]|uniref:Copper-binding protein MbnP-like domain-containing protein n=1 Tax=Labilithrix luteola TaxID=1391654 RepID=A0A0K1PPM0_9BACT|nr:MbnP family copper-binding protein [Labilithrix luteola]AKU95467.1 hypothetical protein AKJ09_02131 [Labilithrix luteola]